MSDKAENVMECFLDKKVCVRFADDIQITGTVKQLDGYLNGILENVETQGKKLKVCHIRGVQVQSIEIM